ncbi:MAG: hypothetical protein LBK72_02535 [Bifidobacteriaceae bacterium]|jgi:predicted metal-dependent HD superfamily phosphohydrolase|nr:hypothetical protein [Bifidobacteriaceae bacterium]
MSVLNVPPWLESAFARAAVDAGATAGREDLADAAARLLARWSDPRRVFHNVRHLVDVLARVDELAAGSHAPALVRLAAFYHGAVFEPRVTESATGRTCPPDSSASNASDYVSDVAPDAIVLPRGANWEDEAASALVARAELLGLGVPGRAADRVAALIGAMKDLTPLPGDADSAVLIDASLGLLAVEPQRYKVYLAEVRRENAGIPLRDFLRNRIATLEAVLARPRLFASLEATAWERAARDNIAAELQRSRRELLPLDAEATDPSCG